MLKLFVTAKYGQSLGLETYFLSIVRSMQLGFCDKQEFNQENLTIHHFCDHVIITVIFVSLIFTPNPKSKEQDLT